VPQGTIGVIKATTGDFLVQQEFPKSKRKEYRSAQDAAKALAKKKIDLFISDSPTVWWLAGMNETEGLTVVRVFLSQEQLAWAVSRSNTGLLQSVNDALDKMQKDGRAAAIVKRWIPLFQ
jgi:polar amino acid transport system substrate-binding protein